MTDMDISCPARAVVSKEFMRVYPLLGLLLVPLVLWACVASEEREPDSAELRDPWAIPIVPGEPTLAAGREVFASCASCHLADASGRPDGTIPRLAGQAASVLEGRLHALQAGSLYLPVMTPFARALTDGEVRQVSAYLASLPSPARVDKASKEEMERGARIYNEHCQMCHAVRGIGQQALNAPRLCGQHAAYLVRRLDEMVTTNERPTDPAMRTVAGAISAEDRRAVSEYLARSECEG